MNEEETYWALKVGHLLKRKNELSMIVQHLTLEQSLSNFKIISEINGEIFDIHSQLIKIYREELDKINEDIRFSE